MTDYFDNEKMRQAALMATKGAMYSYRAGLRTKMALTNAAINRVEKMEKKYYRPALRPADRPAEKGKKDMKNIIALAAALATAGATLAAAGYYLYKKQQELDSYEDIIFDDEMNEENYINYEIPDEDEEDAPNLRENVMNAAKSAIETAESAIDDMRGTVADVVDTVSEFIDTVKDKAEEKDSKDE